MGTTVFLNSHFLSEVEVTCDRVSFIKDGVVVHTSTLDSLVEGEISLDIRAQNLTSDVLAGISQWGRNIRANGEYISMVLDDDAVLPEINRFLVESGVDVYAFRPQKLSLEDMFIKVVGED